MALNLLDDELNTNPAVPVASTMSGDLPVEAGSVYAMMKAAGVPSAPEADDAVRQAFGPKRPVYADPEDPQAVKVGQAGDLWQLDPDPTGDITKQWGAKNGVAAGDADVPSLNVGGKLMSRGYLSQTDWGRSLLEIAERRRAGHRRNFFDAMNPLDWGPDKIPFVSLFATVGKSISDARLVSGAFEKMQKGEPVTDEELGKTALYINEQRERSDGTWGSTVGDIISQAPGFMAEFFATGGMLAAARKTLAGKIAENAGETGVKALSHIGLRTTEKVLADESAEQLVKAGIAGYAKEMLKDSSAAGLAKAAGEFAANGEIRKATVAKVADVIEKSLLTDEALAVTGAGSWSPGVMRKVAEHRAEQAVASAIAQRSPSPVVQRALRSAGRVLADGVTRGLLDAGNWGTEASTVLFSERSSAGRALVDALNTFLVEAPLKGGEMLLANKAVTAPVSAALGGTVGSQELAIRQAAYMNSDEDLMNKASAIGLGLDLLEYVSENTGRGLKSMLRAGALAVNPRLAKAASKTAGSAADVTAKILKEPSEKGFVAKGVEYSGLLEPGSGAEVGGIISRYVNKFLGKPEDMRAATAAERFAAVDAALRKQGIAANATALERTLAEGKAAVGLGEDAARAIGTDVAAFAESALKAAYSGPGGKVEGMKMRCYAQYWAADFMARHQIGPQTAMQMFEKMGYDGIAGEMFEERYSDVVSALFGLDAEKDHSLKARMKNALEGMFPGWDQLTAEAVGFAFPMVVRAGTVRALEAIGGEPAYRRYRETAAMYLDAVRHGHVGEWRLGDLVSGNARAVEAEKAKLADATARRAKAAESRPEGADEMWDRENLAPIDAEIEKATRAVKRLEDVHATFMDSLSEETKADMESTVAYAPLSAEQAELPDEEYNRTVHAIASQARQALSAGKILVSNAAEMGQTLYKMQARSDGESVGAFRKAAHWVVKSAGALVSGDPGLMSMNPAKWHGVDVGLPDTVQDALRLAYGTIYESELKADQDARAKDPSLGSPHEADADAAHARALARFQPVAQRLMAADLAAHQTVMFTDAEFRDLAMDSLARERDLVPDASGKREYVGKDGSRVSFDDFYAKHERFIGIRRSQLARTAFDAFASGSLQQGRMVYSRRGADTDVIADVIDTPKDLPTRDQAMLAILSRGIPGLRNVLRAHEVSEDKPIDDQIGGMATRQSWLDRVCDAVMPGGLVTADAVAEAERNAGKADPDVLEAIARDLNFTYDGTEDGLKARNRELVRLAVLSRTLSDPNVRTYSRDGIVDEADRSAADFSEFTTARRRADGQWSYRTKDGKEGVAADEAALDAAMSADGGWSVTTPRVVFTAAQALQSSDYHSMISALGLKRLYAKAMNDAGGKNVDPLYRRNAKGEYEYKTVDEALAQRELERVLASEYEATRHQEDPKLYLRPGQSADNAEHLSAAEARMKLCRQAYYTRNGDTGYVTVANDLLRRRGVTVPFAGTGVSFGTLNADLRGKYVISVNAFRSRNSSGNIYVPINHEVAQNYEAALLNAVVIDAYFKNRRILADVYDSGLARFIKDLDAVARTEQERVSADGDAKNDYLAKNISDFRAACTAAPDGGVRKPNPTTFAILTSAFALFQTERPGNAKSNLGDFAPALKAIAKQVRSLPSYQEFVGAVDRVFGGSGFNEAEVQAAGGMDSTRGIARLFAMFAPTDSRSYYDAVQAAAPGGLTATEFVKRVNDMDTSAWNAAKGRTRKAAKAAARDKGPKGGVPAGLAPAAAVQAKVAEGAPAAEVVAKVAPSPAPEAPKAPASEPMDLAKKFLKNLRRRQQEVRSDMEGGNVSEEKLDEARALADDADAVSRIVESSDAQARRDAEARDRAAGKLDTYEEADEAEVEEVDEDDPMDFVAGDLSMLVDVARADADSSHAETVVQDRADLTENEIKAIVPVIGSMVANMSDNAKADADGFMKFVVKMAPWIRRSDLRQLVAEYARGTEGKSEEDLAGLWAWPEDDVEEGMLPDGYEASNEKSVKVLQTKALNNFLAFASIVNPHTGRQFQAFMEDLRATVARGIRDASLSDEAKEALKFVDRLVNPRANDAATPALRDAHYAALLAEFTDGDNADAIARRISALVSGNNPANRKAAALLGYLAYMPANVRRQMTQLVSSSAPSEPVRLNVAATPEGKVTFLIEPRKGSHSRLSVTAVSALFSSFAGRDASECVKAADRIDALAKQMSKDGRFSVDRTKGEREQAEAMFSAVADLLATEFGNDCPFVSVLSSKTTVASVAANSKVFDSVRSGMTTVAGTTAVPYIVSTVTGGLRYLAANSKGRVTEDDASLCSVLVNTMGDPTKGDLTWQTNTSRTTDRIATIFSLFDANMPRTIMTAEVDPVRSNKPASSVAITMRGVEPAVQVFMDRTDDKGFRKVCEKFFPEFAALSESAKRKALGVCRQGMCWPVAGRPSIVAKSLSKTAFAGEVYAGCETAYNLGRDLGAADPSDRKEYGKAKESAVKKYGWETVNRFRDDNTFYVPVYSGDHSSSIIVSVPLAKEFRATMSYEEAARTVSSWIGLDLLGVDAKRSAVTCLEAPGVGFVGFKRDANGKVVTNKVTGEDGVEREEPATGECRVNIVWNSEGGKNEAMLGTTLGYGYGLDQLKLCAKDPKSATLKFHAMNTSNSGKYGAHLSLIKSLNTAFSEDSESTTGAFPAYTATRAMFDFIRRQRSSDAKWSTSILTDFDSVKLALANSKMMGVDDGGKPVALMEYVFRKVAEGVKAGGKMKDAYTDKELDELVGEFDWTDLAVPERSKKGAVVSDILDGVRLERVPGLAGTAFSLSYVDNDMMGFQVANVSHRSKPEYGKTPRNYMVDAMAMTQVLLRGWNADSALKGPRPVKGENEKRQDYLSRVNEWESRDPLFTNLSKAVGTVQDLIAGWGRVAADLASAHETKTALLYDSEDAQQLRLHGENEYGRFMRDVLARALSTHLKKNLNVPLDSIAAPLVSNVSWLDGNGEVRTQSQSRMFRDTLQGSRTIPASKRGFFGGHRRMAICNMNCSDPSFRYGMYLKWSSDQSADAVAELKTLFADELSGYAFESGKADEQVVEIFDRAFTALRDLEESCLSKEAKLAGRSAKEKRENPEDADWLSVHDLRRRIASCFTDHYGNDMSLRARRFSTRIKDPATGKRTKGPDGSADWYDEVSYDDLFTNLRLKNGRPSFDRTAFYFGMHRDAVAKTADGRVPPATTHMYLGGTMVGLPRTPSYNGSMWLQTVRAGLPVTEIGDAASWRAGRDAMVAPDPYTLAILGCDHDGDKTNLYMLNAPSRGRNFDSKAKKALAAAPRFLPESAVKSGDYSAYYERRRDPKTKTLHEWQLNDLGRMQANNTFVQGLFDMSRAMAVPDNTDASVPFYSGDVLDESTAGCMAPGTKASLVYKKLWESAISKNKKVIADAVLDPKSGRTIGDPKTAARVGDGAQNAADARAIVVSLASSLHLAWSSGLFAGRLFRSGLDAEGAKAWLDFMHHLDGFSNMTFDDIKEQVCSRLGVSAGMMDTIVVDMINDSVKRTGRVPRTDAEFVEAFAKYAVSVNHEGSRSYMNRAVNKGDFDFLARVRKAFGAEPKSAAVASMFGLVMDKPGIYVRSPGAKGRYAGLSASIAAASRMAAEDLRLPADDAKELETKVLSGVVRELTRDYSDVAGYVLYLAEKAKGPQDFRDFVSWYWTRSQLKAAKSFAKSVNYVTADPSANNASEDAVRREEAFVRTIYSPMGGLTADAAAIPKEQLDRLIRMHESVKRAYSLSDAKTVQDYAADAVRRYDADLDVFVSDITDGGDRSVETQFAVRLLAAERLNRMQVLQSEANAQMVGLALAAFRSLRPVPGSGIGQHNALRVLRAIGIGSAAAVRHDGRTSPALDAKRGIEDLFELMYRLVMSSTVRNDNSIFSYFSERNDSFPTAFNDAEYYGTNELLGGQPGAEMNRITLAFQGVTEGQMADVRKMYDRVVSGELDKAERTDVRTKAKSAFGFSLSKKSLAALRAELTSKDAKGDLKHKGNAEAVKLVAEAERILDQLAPVLGEDVEITPSMMFGQILPLYAAFTTRTDRAPDSRSSSLLAAFGDTYERWSAELAAIESSPWGARLVRMLSGVNWAVPNVRNERHEGDPMKRPPKRKTRAMMQEATKGSADRLATLQLALTDPDATVRETEEYRALRRDFHARNQSLTNPRGRYVIDVFGNSELFGSALEYLSSDVRAESYLAAEPEDAAVPEASAGSSGENVDPYVKELADRMGALLRNATGLRIDYDGGTSFTIHTKLTGSALKGQVPTAVRVSVVDSLVPEAGALAEFNSKKYRLSLAASTGVPYVELCKRLDAIKTDAEKVAFFNEHRVYGESSEAESDWAVDLKKIGTLCGEIRLERQDKKPGAVYHEYFHTVMRMFRQLGVLSDADVEALAGRFGKLQFSNGRKWFNEEQAAEKFRAFVESGEAHEQVRGIFQKLFDVLKSLYKALVTTGVKSSDFGKNMNENPLAAMVLYGTAVRSSDPSSMDAEVHDAVAEAVNGGELDADVLARKLLAPEAKPASEPLDITAKFLKRRAARMAERGQTDEELAKSGTEIVDDTPFRMADAGGDALDVIFPDRMEGNYSQFNTVARAIGMAVRNGLKQKGLDKEALDLLASYSRLGRAAATEAQKAAAEEAVRKVADVYGIDLGKGRSQKGSKLVRNLVFRAMIDVNSGAARYASTDGRSGGPVADNNALVTSSDLASAILVSCGTKPCHLARAARRDLEPLAKRYAGTSFADVVSRCDEALKALEAADPSMLCDSPELREKVIGEAIHSLQAGLVGGMNGAPYRLGELGTSDNPNHDANIGLYGNFVDAKGDGNPDFQSAMRRTLDTLYTAAAGMKFYRELGFEPGSGAATALDPAPVPPKTADETAQFLGVEARQMLDRNFDAIDFMDQPAFVANNVEAYLESTVRNTFGKIPVGELMAGVRDRQAGYVRRLGNAENWLAALLGQNVLPGQKLHDCTVVDGKFAMEAGKVVAKAGGKYLRFELYKGKRTGISLTEDEHRLVDLVLKCDKAYYQGARNAVTGVDEIRFTRDDSENEADYSRKKIEDKVANHQKLSDFERALVRLDLQLPAWAVNEGLGIREKFVKAACEEIAAAKKMVHTAVMANDLYFSDRVLRRLDNRGILVSHEAYNPGSQEHTRDRGALVVPVDSVESYFQSSTALDKLVRARANAADSADGVRELFSRKNRIAPLDAIYREYADFVRKNPWLTDGDGAFFNNFRTPLAFVRGSGVFMYNANRTARSTGHEAYDKMTREEETFLRMMEAMGDEGYAGKSLREVSSDQLRFLADLYDTYETDAESFRRAILDGKYEQGTDRSREKGLVLGAGSGMREVVLAIYNRLVENAWRENGDPVPNAYGRLTVTAGSARRMAEMYEERRLSDQSLTGGVGLTDEMVYRINGELPANHQLGHAIHNQMEGITNAIVFRNTLVSMLMTPDNEGRPTVYADPSALAAEAGGVPDEVWGTIARWWAKCNEAAHNTTYDETKSGIQNARDVYRKLHDAFSAGHGKVNGAEYGELKAEELDCKSIVGVLAQKDDRESKLNALGGGYAMGYAKQLMQASRHLGSAAQRAVVHRALSWSKSMSVSFSFFFPLATKYESPWGAVGATAMLGSNHFAETVRKNPEAFNAVQKAFGGSGWITKDFLGFQDVVKMMDSNDPFLGELVGWASALGVSLSDSLNNPIETQRSVLQRDLANLREMMRDRFGAKAAKRFDDVTRALLLRSGDKAFTYALNATKLATVAQICMKLRHEAEKTGRAFDPVRDLKRYSGYINAEIGGIDPLKYAWAHPMNRGIMNMLLFSWEWTRGAWEAGGGGALEDFFFGGHNMTAEERKYIVGRWARMFGGVMIGVPMMFQILVKAIAKAMGHDDDEEKWFTWQNEDKACWTAFSLKPLLAAMSERFPRVAQWKKEHPVLGSLLPMYTGSDRANAKFGSFDPVTGKSNGRDYYMHFGKQGWEEFRWFSDPSGQFFSKLSMPIQRMLEGVFGRSLSWMDHELPWSEMSFAERWLTPSMDSATANMVKAFMPFTLAGLTDRGDAGILSAFGPIQMGASATATQDKVVKVLKDWAFNDRRGYRPAYPVKGKFKSTVTGLNSGISQLVREAMHNGASRADALSIVDSAIGRLTASLYGDLMDALPQSPSGDFDAEKVSRCVRAINRLGRKRSAVVKAIKDRLESKKVKLQPELAARWNAILNNAYRDPYGLPGDTNGGEQ